MKRGKAMKGLKTLVLLFACLLPTLSLAQPKRPWRTATSAELEAVLPDRATVEKERIETEARSATGVIDSKGKVIAAIVLITAGYSANGKYSHYLVAQSPLRVGGEIALASGNYVIGWTRNHDGLLVKFYVAETGVEKGSILARLPAQPLPVVPLKIWAPSEKGVIQIGRFAVPWTPEE